MRSLLLPSHLHRRLSQGIQEPILPEQFYAKLCNDTRQLLPTNQGREYKLLVLGRQGANRGDNPIPIYNGYLILGYATLYTMFPVFSLVTDEDVTPTAVIKFPILYSSLQKGRVLNTKTFLIWMWKSVFQGCIIMLGSVLVFPDS